MIRYEVLSEQRSDGGGVLLERSLSVSRYCIIGDRLNYWKKGWMTSWPDGSEQ